MGTSNSKQFCEEFGLVNIFDHIYPDHEKFKTYQFGSTALDYAISDVRTADEVKKAVAEPFCYRWKGDHQGMHYDIPERIIFGNKMENVYHSNGRGINSKDTKQVTK